MIHDSAFGGDHCAAVFAAFSLPDTLGCVWTQVPAGCPLRGCTCGVTPFCGTAATHDDELGGSAVDDSPLKEFLLFDAAPQTLYMSKGRMEGRLKQEKTSTNGIEV